MIGAPALFLVFFAEGKPARTACMLSARTKAYKRLNTVYCNSFSADPGTTDQAVQQYWNAVVNVSQGLHDALQAAAAVVGDSFVNHVCNAKEVEEEVKSSKVPLLAPYSSAQDLFWKTVIDDVNSIRVATARAR